MDLGDLATWFSAAGSISAVTVSLYLANRDNFTKAHVLLIHREDGSEFIILNERKKPIHLRRIGLENKIFFFFLRELPFLRDYNINKKIDSGEELTTIIDMKDLMGIIDGLGFREFFYSRYFIYYEDIKGKKYQVRFKFEEARRIPYAEYLQRKRNKKWWQFWIL